MPLACQRDLRVGDQKKNNDRRTFLLQAGLASAASLAPHAGSAVVATSPRAIAAKPESAPSTYQSLGPDEASFIEALVNVMCPADEFSPNGVDCGLAVYIDRQLAGPYGQGDRRYQRGPFKTGRPELGWQLPLTPEQFCKTGIAAVNLACVRVNGATFDQLAPATAEAVLKDIGSGRLSDERLPLASWFNDIIYPLFIEACFADPMYGGNRDAVFCKMVGYPGLPATYTLDMARYRGKPHPGAKNPKSIIDFS
jgi:gluconate 2-dehydrogenase gamma chain